jgi:hypothetical protein
VPNHISAIDVCQCYAGSLQVMQDIVKINLYLLQSASQECGEVSGDFQTADYEKIVNYAKLASKKPVP